MRRYRKKYLMDNLNKNKGKNYCFQLSEYLQVACNGMHSVKLNITENDILTGNITIENGVLLNATDNEGEGEDAFKRLVLNKNIEIEMKQLARDDKKKIISSKCEELIFRIFTTKDKEKAILELSKKAKMELSPLDIKKNEGLNLLLEKDYKKAHPIFKEIEKEFPEDKHVRSILKRLDELL